MDESKTNDEPSGAARTLESPRPTRQTTADGVLHVKNKDGVARDLNEEFRERQDEG